MKRDPEQTSLLVLGPADLARRALRRVRACPTVGLEEGELEALEAAVALLTEAGPKPMSVLIGAWLCAYEGAFGGTAPRLTDVEAKHLGTLARRLGGVDTAKELIPYFFRWRASMIERYPAMVPPGPHPVGMSKHVASVQAFAAEERVQRETAETARKAREAAAERFKAGSTVADKQDEGERWRPAPEEMRAVVQKLSGGMTRPYLEKST